MDFTGRRIVILISGGIAAYKAADLVSRLRKAGAEVRVAMSSSARNFVAPLTFEALSGHPVYELDFAARDCYEMQHISWARWAEAVVAAMASANLIAKLAHGIGDDAPSILALAYQGPLWVAPSMNTTMLGHPATQHNLKLLRQRGAHVIEPGSGPLACGETGAGRMAEPDDIIQQLAIEFPAYAKKGSADGTGLSAVPAGGEALQQVLARVEFGNAAQGKSESATLAGKTVLITTGPTRESLDPIRFLSNRSTGKMGCELAFEALRRGARVLLVHGPLSVAIPPGVEAISGESARQMLAAVQSRWDEVDLAIFAAAVANYEAPTQNGQKIKGGDSLTLQLQRTPDIAAWCGSHRHPHQVLVGFCAESQNLMETAARKLQAKQLDFICANPIGEPGVGFAAEENQITILSSSGEATALPRGAKTRLAGLILDHVTMTPATAVE